MERRLFGESRHRFAVRHLRRYETALELVITLVGSGADRSVIFAKYRGVLIDQHAREVVRIHSTPTFRQFLTAPPPPPPPASEVDCKVELLREYAHIRALLRNAKGSPAGMY